MNVCLFVAAYKVFFHVTPECNLPPGMRAKHAHTLYTQLTHYSTKVLAGNYGPDAVACGDRLNQTVSHPVK